jgi:hypothetical protein
MSNEGWSTLKWDSMSHEDIEATYRIAIQLKIIAKAIVEIAAEGKSVKPIPGVLGIVPPLEEAEYNLSKMDDIEEIARCDWLRIQIAAWCRTIPRKRNA